MGKVNVKLKILILAFRSWNLGSWQLGSSVLAVGSWESWQLDFSKLEVWKLAFTFLTFAILAVGSWQQGSLLLVLGFLLPDCWIQRAQSWQLASLDVGSWQFGPWQLVVDNCSQGQNFRFSPKFFSTANCQLPDFFSNCHLPTANLE